MLKANDVLLYWFDVTRRSSLLEQVLGCERRELPVPVPGGTVEHGGLVKFGFLHISVTLHKLRAISSEWHLL